MYIPAHYKLEDAQEIEAIINRYDFATVVTNGMYGPVATHVPVVYMQEGEAKFVEGHFALANDHWKVLGEGQKVLVIFQGPHAYVSPRYYTSEQNVPTWNYVAVHVYGKAELVYGEGLIQILNRLTEKNEQNRTDPWSLKQMDQGDIEKMSRAIVGFRIAVERVEAKAKMSQNKPTSEILSLVEGLRNNPESGGKSTAAYMEKLNKVEKA